jgi:hypothetical protein
VLLALVPGIASALPGDLTVEMELEEREIEATPEETAATVTFHGNLTFDQPVWQYATARVWVDVDKNWSTTASPETVTNRGPGTQTFTVTVEVPPSARGGEVANIEVLAEYSTRFGGTQVTSDMATVRVRPWVGYRVNTTGPVELVLLQGTSGVLRVPLRNVGNMADTWASSVPYWYGLRPMGLIVVAPAHVTVPEKDGVELEFTVSVAADAVPRLYVFDLVLDAATLPRGGDGATEDPRMVRAEVHVTGDPPPDDPYEAWELGDPPDPVSSWRSVFGSSAPRNNPDVDPSGTYLVFDQVNGAERLIYLGEVTGSGARPLTRGHVDHHPVISPNGQMVAFARAPDRIIIVNHDGSELMEFGTDLGWVNLTDWSPSGDRILLDASGDIYELDLRYNTTQRLAGEPVEQWGAVYSEDAGRIFYLSFEAAGPKAEIWSMTSDGSGHRQLTFNDLAEPSVSVSPNGMRVAFSLEGGPGQGDRVCVMDVDGSNVRYFTDLSREVFVLRWLPEGDSLVAEVTAHNATTNDIERIKYPWKDAGASGGDGGDGNGGGGGTGIGWWDDLMGGYGRYLLIIIGVLIVVAIGGTYYRHQRKREQEAAAEDLKRQMEAEERARWERARQEIEVGPGSPYGNYGNGHDPSDGSYRYR